ncbi:MAG: hypothetical protein R2751_09660 [Bacteroidales bacterium]
MVPEAFASDQVEEVRFSVSENGYYKNLQTVLDILANNDWKRPVYFSTTVSSDYYLNLDDYFVREGLALRLAPVRNQNPNYLGRVDTEAMYTKLMEEFDWGGIQTPGIYMDENNLRMTIHYRYAFSVLAAALAEEGKTETAKEVLDHCMQQMPKENVPYNAGITPLIQGYFSAGDTATANELVGEYSAQLERELQCLNVLSQTGRERFGKSQTDYLSALRDINTLGSVCLGYGETDKAREMEDLLSMYGQEYERLFR